jgi:hypothetical protein
MFRVTACKSYWCVLTAMNQLARFSEDTKKHTTMPENRIIIVWTGCERFEKEISQKYILKMLLLYYCVVDGGSCGEGGGGRLCGFRCRRRQGWWWWW